MRVETKPFDAADYLQTDEDMAGYMTEALATRDMAVIGRAVEAIARARGRLEKTGISDDALRTALSADNPEFATVLRILEAIGLRLTAEPISKAA